MKGFFKFTFASILGVLIGLFIFFLIIAGIIGAATREKPLVLEDNTVLLAKFDQPVVDRQPESPFSNFDPVKFTAESNLGLDMILSNIEKAAKDDNIEGIVLDLTTLNAGMAMVEEIRNAILRFKEESGKFVWSYAELYTQKSYYLATAADKIYMTPEGNLFVFGLSSEQIFIKKMLEKLGIEAQVIRHGEYKAAAEPFMYEELSDENREQISNYLNSLWDHMVENISDTRNIPVAEINHLADDLIISSGKAAVEHGFVDQLIYFDEFLDMVKELTGTDPEDDLNSIAIRKYTKAKVVDVKEFTRDKIAVFYASGNIVMGEGLPESIGADRFARSIRKARRDSSVKAIVLRVNSGGGSALASDIIWREVKLAAETKPLIASMGNVAASGGYYIVAPADKIYADPNTITGSIGVIGVLPNLKEFLNQKIGITTDVVKTNDHSDVGSVFRPLDPEEMQKLQSEVGNAYKTFVSKVAEGRGMSFEKVDSIGRGHVYSGIDAKAIGLVDEFGGLKEATMAAAEAAGLENYRVVKYPEIRDPFIKLIEGMSAEARMKQMKKELGENFYYYEIFNEVKEMEGVQARLPFFMKVY